jgi:hypothetical protein
MIAHLFMDMVWIVVGYLIIVVCCRTIVCGVCYIIITVYAISRGISRMIEVVNGIGRRMDVRRSVKWRWLGWLLAWPEIDGKY